MSFIGVQQESSERYTIAVIYLIYILFIFMAQMQIYFFSHRCKEVD